jgi:hypothetical protein
MLPQPDAERTLQVATMIQRNSSPNRPRKRLLWVLLALPFAVWMGLALALRLPGPPMIATALGILVPLAALLALAFFPRRRGVTVFASAFSIVLLGFLALRPSNERDWMPDVARTPTGLLEGNRLTVKNIRNCEYRTEADYDARFVDRTYDLDRLQGVDLFLVSWGPRHIAHTILSFDFGEGEHLAFSIETRKEKGESYSALRGFFREYELCVVAGLEEDLIRLRSNFRGETVRLYRLNTPPALARGILADYVDRINGLATHPEWYDALMDNCTTAMIGPIRQHSRRLPWSWKLIASGHLDELLYDQGIVRRDLPFEALRQAAVVNAKALADSPMSFSNKIRDGLPPR